MNLLSETVSFLEDKGLKVEDVLWVGTSTLYFTWEDFVKVADVEYDSGYGAQEVASDLILSGNDWWASRSEYDGSEYWTIHKRPVKPAEYKKPDCLTVEQAKASGHNVACGWCSLDELNGYPVKTSGE